MMFSVKYKKPGQHNQCGKKKSENNRADGIDIRYNKFGGNKTAAPGKGNKQKNENKKPVKPSHTMYYPILAKAEDNCRMVIIKIYS